MWQAPHHLFQPASVQYLCSCGSLRPLSRIYFCRHCLQIRCGRCVTHEVDSHYCPNCLENMPSAEARLKKNRCANCFDCPSCLHTLSTRASTVQSSDVDTPSGSKPPPKKVYYLACSFCRWTSRDVGIKDQSVASGGWGDPENPDASRIQSLLDHYRTLAQREKIEKDKKRFQPRRSYMHFSDKFGLSSTSSRKRAGLVPPNKEENSLAPEGSPGASPGPTLTPAVALEEVDQLPPSFLELPLNLSDCSGMQQRLAQPESQPQKCSNLAPPHKHLMVKRSQRCQQCEHNLSKPEYNPTSIKFKIQLAAFYHVPEVRLVRFDLSDAIVVVKIGNPSPYPTHVSFLPLEEEKGESSEAEQQMKDVSGAVGPTAAIQLALPNSQILLPAKDDTAEYDEFGDSHAFDDDPKVVVWRKANKASVQLGIIAETKEDAGTEEEEDAGKKQGEGEKEAPTAAFRLCYEYINTVAALEQREPQRLKMVAHIYLQLKN